MSAMEESAMVCSVAPVEAIVRVAQYVPVFPCRPGMESIEGKNGPIIRKAKSPYTLRGFRDATQDADQIRAWWNTNPRALVGVPTGSTTNLIAIDYDSYKASAEANAWIEAHTDILMGTRSHTTLGGGRHYLFRPAPGARYQSGTDLVLDGATRKGIDLRAEGGYIIWWPLHGGIKMGDPVRLPTGLIDERLMQEHVLEDLPKFSPSKWQVDQPLVADALAYLDPHSRDDWRNWGLAIHLASGGSDLGFELWHAWSAGELTGELPHNYSGINDCRYHWSTFRHDKDRAHTVTLGSLFAAARKNGYTGNQKQEVVRAPKPDPSATEILENSSAIQSIEIPSLSQIHEMEVQGREWFFQNIPEGAFLVVGRPKIGKSWLLMQLALAAAQIRPFLGFEPTGGAEVLYIGAEDDYARIRSRVAAFRLSEVPKNLHVMVGEQLQTLAAKFNDQYTFAEFLDLYLSTRPGIKFVIMDTEATIRAIWDQGRPELDKSITRNDYAEVREFDIVALRRHVFIALVNHARKRGNAQAQWQDIHELINRTNTALAGASGSMVLADPPDAQPDDEGKLRVFGIRGRDIKDDVLLAVEQDATGAFVSRGPFFLHQQTQTESDILECLESLSAEAPESWHTSRDIADEIGSKQGSVKRAISRMMKAGKDTWKHFRVETKPKLGVRLVRR